MKHSGVFRRRLRELWRSRRGGAAVELAVALPILILLAIGVIDYGRVFYTSIAVANAARAGAEYGVQNSSTSVNSAEIENFAERDGAEAGIEATSQTVYRCGATVVSASTSCGSYGPARVFVEVTASRKVGTFFKYPGLPDSIPILRKATFRLQ